jgi:hypothetical protein
MGKGQHRLSPPATTGSSQEVCDASCGVSLGVCLHRQVRCGPGRPRTGAHHHLRSGDMPEQSILDHTVLAHSVSGSRRRDDLALEIGNSGTLLGLCHARTRLDEDKLPSGKAVMILREARATVTRQRPRRSPGRNPLGGIHSCNPIESRLARWFQLTTSSSTTTRTACSKHEAGRPGA